MPLAPCMPVLSAGIVPILQPATAPKSLGDAATAWARAWTNYAVAGGIQGALAKENALAAALAAAFVPNGSGPVLMVQALTMFWMVLPVPAQAGIICSYIPSVAAPVVPPDPTPQQQADALAQMLHAMTMSALLVQNISTGVITPIL
jgi:hypothetical protein